MPFWLGQKAADEWRRNQRPAVIIRASFEQYLRAAVVAVRKIG